MEEKYTQDEVTDMIRRVQETAWAEGWNASRLYGVPRSENPYRKRD